MACGQRGNNKHFSPHGYSAIPCVVSLFPSMKRILKWIGIALGGVVVLLLLAGGALYVNGGRHIAATHDVAVASLAIPADSASIARGAHLAGIYGCVDCHGPDLAGQEMEDAPPFRLVASNLTPAGVGGTYTSADWDRAIRHGVRANGTALFVMPSGAYNKLSDTETSALIAYLQTLSPVENDFRGIEWKAMGRLLAGGPIHLSDYVYTNTPPTTSPEPDSSSAYGEYVATMMCAYCHGPHLEGQMTDGPEESSPPTSGPPARGPPKRSTARSPQA